VTNAELEKNVKGFSKDVEQIFLSYPWYGNLRELKNVVKRATLLTDGELIDAKSLPFEIAHYSKLQFDKISEDEDDEEIEDEDGSYENKLKSANIDAEYEVILSALKKSNYNKSKAAKLLNIDRKTLYNKMKQYQAFKLDL
jgi:two-component system response regulator HydG